MAWRLQLASRPVRRLDILPGKPSLLAAWSAPDHLHFFDLQHGASFEPLTLSEPEPADLHAPEWSAYLAGLKAPNEARLPVVRARAVGVYSGLEAGTWLLQRPDGLTLRTAAGDTPLAVADPRAISLLAFDRAQAVTAFLDREAKLHVYRGPVRVGEVDTGLILRDEALPQLAVAEGGLIFAGDGAIIVIYDSTGAEKRRWRAHFDYAALACSPDGRLLALADLDSSVLRVFNTSSMAQSYQRFTVDLLADARKAQLLPVTASTGAAVSAIAINNKGTLAFSTLGLICVTSVSRMKAAGR